MTPWLALRNAQPVGVFCRDGLGGRRPVPRRRRPPPRGWRVALDSAVARLVRPNRDAGPARSAWQRRLAVLVASALWLGASAAAQEIAASSHAESPPPELAAAIVGALSAGGVRAGLPGNTLDFWWVRGLENNATSAGTGAWARVAQGTLVGVVRIAAPFREIRGKPIKPGVYTLRYGVQPVNGDHLGVSPFRDFLLLCPAARDADPMPLGYEGVARMSATSIGGAHPGALSVDPPETSADLLSGHTTELGHKALVVEVPLASGGTLRFGLVLVGKVEA